MKIQKNRPALEIIGLRSSLLSLDSLTVQSPVLLVLMLLLVLSRTVH